MPKTGENIHKRKDGRWEARYIKSRNADGSICYGYVYARKYSEVKQKRDLALLSLQKLPDNPQMHSDTVTLNKIFDEWKECIRYAIKDSSYFFYETLLEHHLRPQFGNLSLLQLDSSALQHFINEKVKHNFSSAYINSMMLLMQNILRFSQKKGYLKTPIPVYQLPKNTKQLLEIFEYNEWKILENYLKLQKDDFSFGVLLCMYTGLRIGELSGLKWKDYDIISGQLMVRRTVYRIKNAAYEKEKNNSKTVLCIEVPKTPSSIRNIPLPSYLLREIPRHLKETETFVLTGTLTCMEPRNIQRRYKKMLETCGLRYLNFHSLRHSFATYGIQKGIDYKTMSEILGHASVNTTLSIYVHSNTEHKRRCLELLMT